jgi:hypothetical protein
MSDTIAALAKRFWRIHPKEIQDLGITREQFYEREMRALVATAELRKLQDIIDSQADRILDQADRIEALEAALREIEKWADSHRQLVPSDIARAALAPEQDK